MLRRFLLAAIAVSMVGVTLIAAGCGRETVDLIPTTVNEADVEATSTTIPPSQDPIQIVFNGEISGPLVYDSALVQKGIRTALQMLQYRVADWSIEYQEMDNQSDPLLAVEQVRQLVQTDTNDDNKKDREAVDFICGPLSSSDTAGVSYFLSQRSDESERVPQCAVTGQPKENITTSGGVGFIPNGIYSSHGYYLGKFAAETLHFETANCIHYADRIAEEMQSGFERGFTAGGGTISSLTYVPTGTVDFASYFSDMARTDCTFFWVRGTGAIPFVREFAASHLTGQLLAAQSSNYSESQLEYLNALGLGLDMISCDVYTPLLENQVNNEFIATYRQLYPGDYPTPEAFGGWQAIMLYAKAVDTLQQQRLQNITVQGAGLDSASTRVVDPRNPTDVIATMANLSLETPAGSITMGKYGKTYVATRDFYILRSKDVGAGRVAWAPLYTFPQVRMGQ